MIPPSPAKSKIPKHKTFLLPNRGSRILAAPILFLMKQITAKLTEAAAQTLDQIRAEQGYNNYGDAIAFLIASKAPKQDRNPDASEAPAGGTGSFSVKIPERAKNMVEEMRADLFEAHSYQDPQILVYMAKIHRKLKQQDAFLVEAPKALKALILKKSQKDVDSGQSKTVGQWIGKFLYNKLKGGW